jgi:hypothetical protein
MQLWQAHDPLSYLEGIVRAVPSPALEKECPGASAELISTTSPKGGNPAVLGHHVSLPQMIFQQQRATAKASADGRAPEGRDQDPERRRDSQAVPSGMPPLSSREKQIPALKSSSQDYRDWYVAERSQMSRAVPRGRSA